MKTRRTFLRSGAALSAGLLASRSFAFSIDHQLEDQLVIGQNGFTYKVDKGWAKVNPALNPVVNCHEMVQDSRGRLIMLGDDIHNNILIFDKSGKLLDSWGTAYPGGHGLTISKENGEDFLLIVDCGFYNDRSGGFQSQAGQGSKPI
jgi:hypothetical protein